MRAVLTLFPSLDIPRLCQRCLLQTRRASGIAPHQRSALTPSCSSSSSSQSLSSRPPRLNLHQRAAHITTSAGRLADQSSSSPPPSSAPAASDPQRPRTHYDLFPETLPDGPPPAGHFPVDTRALRREFLQLQARTHPDLQPAESKARAEAASALVNEAYRTLASPLLRAQYLLSLRGVDVAEDETLKVEEPELLMLVLEAREEIEDAASEEDLDHPRALNDERIRQSEEALDRAFAAGDVEAAKREAVRLRYWINIKDSMDNWEKGKPVVLEH